MTRTAKAATAAKSKAAKPSKTSNGHAPTAAAVLVPLDKILVVGNVRKEFDPDGMRELTASIKSQGVLQPVIVRSVKGARYTRSIAPANDAKQLYSVLPLDDVSLREYQIVGRDAAVHMEKMLAEDHYQLVAGERRFRAATAAGLKEIPAVVRTMSEEEAELAQATENLQRRDLLPIEEAEAYQVISRHHGIHGLDELAARVGKQVRYVAERLKLLDLSELTKKLLHDGQLPLGHALELAKLGHETQDKVLQEIVYEFEWNDKKNAPEDPDRPVPLAEVKQMIEREVYRNLSAAPWPKDWAPEGYANGACATCRFNTANDSVLFADAKGGGRCTNGVSFEQKMRLWFDKRSAEIKAETSHDALLISTQSYSVGSYEMKRYSLPKGTLGRSEYRELTRKEAACETARAAVVVHGQERGHTRRICADKRCKVHFDRKGASVADSSRKSPKEEAKEREKRNERKQELFDMRVAGPVRLEVFRQLKDKIEWRGSQSQDTDPDSWPVERFYLNQIAMRLIEKTTYHTMKAVREILGEEWGNVLDGHSWNVQPLVEKLEATSDRELLWITFLISVAHFGENEYMHHAVDQSAVVSLAEQHGINYKLIDAEERLKQAPRKYQQAHLEYVEAVKNAAQHPQALAELKPPKVYAVEEEPRPKSDSASAGSSKTAAAARGGKSSAKSPATAKATRPTTSKSSSEKKTGSTSSTTGAATSGKTGTQSKPSKRAAAK